MSFTLIKKQKIDTLNIDYEHYRHNETGAEHFHLLSDNTENVFLVGLRTIPEDSKGCAHILEHTVLCGSKRYPVRDPFFMMLKRSLNTFMNAFTSSDWTAYPFASQNPKDFDNLLQIYLDAVFFPNLNKLDFCQEGHRLEFENQNDTNSPLVIKGVVYNEMKGAMSSATNTLWHELCRTLFPSTTYHYNSGGDPAVIPTLTHEQLIAFHKKFYHPSNALFMTFGNMPASAHQEKFQQLVLKHFTKSSDTIGVKDEKRLVKPQSVTSEYAIEDNNTTKKTHIVCAWLLNQSYDSYEVLKWHLVSQLLLEHSASPLRQALETTKLALTPSPLCGLEDDQRQMSFMCGVEGSEAKHSQAIEALVNDVLTRTAESGFSKSEIEAVLEQIEIAQREIKGDSYPFGLQLILRALPVAIHRGNPLTALDITPALNRLKKEIEDPDFIPNLIKNDLLNNQHKVTLTLTPSTQLSQQRMATLQQDLKTIKASLTDQQKTALITQTQALNDRQKDESGIETLPNLTLADIPDTASWPKAQVIDRMPVQTDFYAQGTNGIVYQHVILPLPALTSVECCMLPILTQFMTELGCDGKSYLETQKWHAHTCGSIHAYTDIRHRVGNMTHLNGVFVLTTKGLKRKYDPMLDLQQKLLQAVSFNEYERLCELVSQQQIQMENSITQNGHKLAMLAASSSITPLAALKHESYGLAAIKSIKALDVKLQKKTDTKKEFSVELNDLYQKITDMPKQLLLIAEKTQQPSLLASLSTNWTLPVITSSNTLDTFPDRAPKHQMWLTNTQVNFCAAAYPAVAMEHEDAPIFSVLASYLKHNYLHNAIREQGGAYGGGAMYDSDLGVFRFFSYRDPRLVETFQDFEDSINWLNNTEIDDTKLTESIISIIGHIDKPSSPAGEARRAFYQTLFNLSEDMLHQYRSRILTVTADDLKRVTKQYLDPNGMSRAVITNQSTFEKVGDLDMTVFKL